MPGDVARHPGEVQPIATVERMGDAKERQVENRGDAEAAPGKRKRVDRAVEKCDAVVTEKMGQAKLLPQDARKGAIGWRLRADDTKVRRGFKIRRRVLLAGIDEQVLGSR